MTTVEEIEEQIERLSADDQAKFRAWYLGFDARRWDLRIEGDLAAERLDGSIAEPVSEYRAGTTHDNPRDAVRLNVTIPSDHRLEITLPWEIVAGPAEILVFPRTSKPSADPAAAMGMDRGKGWVAADFDAPLPEEIQRSFEGEA